MQCCYGNFISGQAREPRLRCKLPLPQVASMDNLSVASCGGQSREDVLSTCRKARPAALHTIGGVLLFLHLSVNNLRVYLHRSVHNLGLKIDKMAFMKCLRHNRLVLGIGFSVEGLNARLIRLPYVLRCASAGLIIQDWIFCGRSQCKAHSITICSSMRLC
jgi:hypothetical protein